MSLTLDVEKRLEAADAIAFYNKNPDIWKAMAKDAYEYLRKGFSKDDKVRRDDVAKALNPVVEADEEYRNFRAVEKLRQKFWITDFTDLIIDRCWDEISE